ncbi:MAG TPA: hypothetical protein DDW50_16050 [Firmicutes bacterium]|jgi:hypothetical protein|nr:hypothetical protein [Bacillota bacterium]
MKNQGNYKNIKAGKSVKAIMGGYNMEKIDATSKIFTAFAKAKGLFQRIMGCVFMAFFGLCIIITLLDQRLKSVPGMIFCSFGVVLGVVVLCFGNRTISTVRRCKRYAEVIADQNEVDVQQIADALSQQVDFVRQDLQEMIANRYFTAAQLDLNSQKISFADRSEKTKITGWSIIANFKRYPISTSAWLLLCLFVLFSLFICVIDFPGRFIVTILGSIGIVVSFLGTRFRSAERQ